MMSITRRTFRESMAYLLENVEDDDELLFHALNIIVQQPGIELNITKPREKISSSKEIQDIFDVFRMLDKIDASYPRNKGYK